MRLRCAAVGGAPNHGGVPGMQTRGLPRRRLRQPGCPPGCRPDATEPPPPVGPAPPGDRMKILHDSLGSPERVRAAVMPTKCQLTARRQLPAPESSTQVQATCGRWPGRACRSSGRHRLALPGICGARRHNAGEARKAVIVDGKIGTGGFRGIRPPGPFIPGLACRPAARKPMPPMHPQRPETVQTVDTAPGACGQPRG